MSRLHLNDELGPEWDNPTVSIPHGHSSHGNLSYINMFDFFVFGKWKSNPNSFPTIPVCILTQDGTTKKSRIYTTRFVMFKYKQQIMHKCCCLNISMRVCQKITIRRLHLSRLQNQTFVKTRPELVCPSSTAWARTALHYFDRRWRGWNSVTG